MQMIAHLTEQFRFYTLPQSSRKESLVTNNDIYNPTCQLTKSNLPVDQMVGDDPLNKFSNNSANWAFFVKLCSDCEVHPPRNVNSPMICLGFWLQCLALLQPQEIAGRDPPRASIRECEANPGVPAIDSSCEKCW